MIFILLSIILAISACKYTEYKPVKNRKLLTFILFLLIVIPAIRFRVGGDTLIYMDEYVDMPNLKQLTAYLSFYSGRYQYLWMLFVASLKSISSEFLLLQIVLSIIVNCSFFYAIKRETRYIFIALLLYFVHTYFYLNFEALRESLAICIFILFGLPFIRKRQWGHYGISVMIAYLFHDSAIILVALPFVYNQKLNSRWILFLVVLAIFLISIYGNIEPYLRMLSLKNLSSERLFYIEKMDLFNVNYVIVKLGYRVLLPAYVFFVCQRNKIKTSIDSFLMFYLIVGIISTCLPAFGRLSDYQLFFSIVYFSEIIGQSKKTVKTIIPFPKFLILVVFSALIYVRLVIGMFASTEDRVRDTHYYNLYVPYVTVFNPYYYPPRENLNIEIRK